MNVINDDVSSDIYQKKWLTSYVTKQELSKDFQVKSHVTYLMWTLN